MFLVIKNVIRQISLSSLNENAVVVFPRLNENLSRVNLLHIFLREMYGTAIGGFKEGERKLKSRLQMNSP